MTALWQLRPLEAGDAGYVLTTWRRVARQMRWLRDLPDVVFCDRQQGWERHQDAVLERCADPREAAKAIVACDPEDPAIIYGYAIVEHEAVHVVYVRAPFRRRGIARAMLAELGVKAPTVSTLDAPRWAQRRWAVEHDPFAAPIGGHLFRAWCVAWRTAFGEFRVVGVR